MPENTRQIKMMKKHGKKHNIALAGNLFYQDLLMRIELMETENEK